MTVRFPPYDTMGYMSLRDTLQSDLVAAMKAGDDTKKTTLRAVTVSYTHLTLPTTPYV